MHTHYEELPVYKKALDLAKYFENVVRHFDKHHKYVIGHELRRDTQDILFLVAKANVKRVRMECLTKAIDRLEDLRIRVRICAEIKAFKSYATAKFPTECIIDLLKQCEGWRSRVLQA